MKIEKNVPMPSSELEPGTPGYRKYPWPEMVPGDSFLIRCPESMVKKIRNRLVVSANAYKGRQNNGWDYATRTVPGGVRIWRIK